MNCEQTPLLEFMRAELGAQETEKVLDHLENCSQCRERLRVIVGLETLYAPERAAWKGAKFWLLAAGFLVAVLLSLFYRDLAGWPPLGSGLPELATTEKYPYFPLQTRSQGEERAGSTAEIRKQAFSAYNGGDFVTAERLLGQAGPEPELLFYRGVSQYLLEQNRAALENLEEAARQDARWGRPADWYRAHIFLRLGRRAEAAESLGQLSREAGEYQEEARRLLHRLN